ncbi:multicopper oxidase [Tilletiaria anomala UBC 951]|uniref:Multicopper oxidase n=1 Tax=Tilletiaria anomala (strain ATCC 24038 / CBS 436.72 / UBC 951) TaxID=1037660 RepID=A0A066W0F0_TILAU|nr:multicopper oxidase [Tilletiaria anomala UBC 951]KDN44544.1 multicopper oxidase [Tilletiaria anomala UBC 951]
MRLLHHLTILCSCILVHGILAFPLRSDSASEPEVFYRRDPSVFYNESNFPAPDKTVTITITRDHYAPDGYDRLHYLVNGQYPGELLVWDEDDWVEVIVNNNSSTPFTIHHHGVLMHGTPQMDGVPGLNQWNIPFGGSFTYRFHLQGHYGAYWAHAHTVGYYSDGLRWPFYVRPKASRAKPWNLISNDKDTIEQLEWAEGNFTIQFRTDQLHVTADEMLIAVHTTDIPPVCYDSFLINGRGRQYCHSNWSSVAHAAELGLLASTRNINSGFSSKGCISPNPAKEGFDAIKVFEEYYGGPCQNTSAPITVYNAGASLAAGRRWLNIQAIEATSSYEDALSIDNHKMWIVAVDGNYVEPTLVDVAELTIGSRLSIMVELDESKAYRDWPIRFTGLRPLQPIEGFALLTYNQTGDYTAEEVNLSIDAAFEHLYTRNNASISLGGLVKSATIWNQSIDVPFNPAAHVPTASNVTLHAFVSQSQVNVWQVGEQPMNTVKADQQDPVLFQLTEEGKTVAEIDSNMIQLSQAIADSSIVDIVVQNPVYNYFGGQSALHPFHLHSHKFWVIGSGDGSFGFDTVEEAQKAGVPFNLENPPLRDGYDVRANGWVVIRFVADAHGVSMFHCHIDDHLVQGMATVLLEGLEQVPKGTFSSNLTTRPDQLRSTANDTVQQGLQEDWDNGVAAGAWPSAVRNASDPWGDPRQLGASLQSVASAYSASTAAAAAASSTAAAQRR